MQSDAFTKAEAEAKKHLDSAKQKYLEQAVPKLNDRQHQWIVEQLARHPEMFDAMMKRYGGGQLKGYIEKYGGEKNESTR
jgi:hypothetical protein